MLKSRLSTVAKRRVYKVQVQVKFSAGQLDWYTTATARSHSFSAAVEIGHWSESETRWHSNRILISKRWLGIVAT